MRFGKKKIPTIMLLAIISVFAGVCFCSALLVGAVIDENPPSKILTIKERELINKK